MSKLPQTILAMGDWTGRQYCTQDIQYVEALCQKKRPGLDLFMQFVHYSNKSAYMVKPRFTVFNYSVWKSKLILNVVVTVVGSFIKQELDIKPHNEISSSVVFY